MSEETYAKQMVERCSEMIVNALQNMSIEDIDMYRIGYEKGRADAIEEVMKKVNELVNKDCPKWCICVEDQDECPYLECIHDVRIIAEQLKDQKNDKN